ncbi:methylated-DNA--[protein]-cysteine S-methyltransferase [Paraflavitalea sp. CAU 1676]|uniref:methylated-DNA--[protein]-cysteine S-methyltransferase n=1 Tax=Paraflavitalea sp. CAU 1676 TaxID=3032598 RepID=UPI0023DAFD9C|nr:methylated-DNA--[protein]-cysteine S-methyltransferase [Paraflavitalea sp. CAU 1676]MDF2190182.1 methylated-DNA--[protein]-cysteine S-methyltransferase [Paraflavitalea sp. CAU 1676]
MLSEKILNYEPVAANAYQYQQIARAIDYLYENFRMQPGLEEVAAQVNMSAFHFQRMFTEWAGISPKRFLQFLTTDYLKHRITGFDNLLDAADAAGLSSQSRVYDLFVNLEAVTPQEYKEKGSGILIEYGFHNTPFGECIIGVTGRGICHLSFLQEGNRSAAIEELEAAWERAQVRENSRNTELMASAIFHRKPGEQEKLSVLVKGTNFQVKVWNALLEVPYGAVSTYQSLAKHIEQPNALQAVGSAVGANPIAYLIPCHRIIRKNLIIGEYHWGTERKKAMLGWEMSKTAI